MTPTPDTPTNMLKLSVVTCTYNGGDYVAEQLESLLAQSRLPDEIVIGDDASTDSTWTQIQAFEGRARARGIRVVTERHAVRLGYVANFSRSLGLATGDVLFLCDQDDAWHPDKISTMAALFEEDLALTFAHSDARLVDSDGKDMGLALFDALELSRRERERVRSGGAFGVYLRRNLATGAASAFRRSLLDAALPLPPEWIHDAWLATLGAALGNVRIIDDALVDYRQHDANQIGMARRTIGQRIESMFGSRNSMIREDASRLVTLLEKLKSEGQAGVNIKLVEAMHRHLEARLVIGSLPRWRRLAGVIREWSSGRYSLFATGSMSMLRDLLRVG